LWTRQEEFKNEELIVRLMLLGLIGIIAMAVIGVVAAKIGL
jgi:hypothetical protein